MKPITTVRWIVLPLREDESRKKENNHIEKYVHTFGLSSFHPNKLALLSIAQADNHRVMMLILQHIVLMEHRVADLVYEPRAVEIKQQIDLERMKKSPSPEEEENEELEYLLDYDKTRFRSPTTLPYIDTLMQTLKSVYTPIGMYPLVALIHDLHPMDDLYLFNSSSSQPPPLLGETHKKRKKKKKKKKEGGGRPVVLVCLSSTYEYIGHIYVKYFSSSSLSVIGIRTSVLNLATRRHTNITEKIFLGLAHLARVHGVQRVHVEHPLPIMRDILQKRLLFIDSERYEERADKLRAHLEEKSGERGEFAYLKT